MYSVLYVFCIVFFTDTAKHVVFDGVACIHIYIYVYLVGGLEHFLFFHILEISSSQLTLIFFRGVGTPPTSITISSL